MHEKTKKTLFYFILIQPFLDIYWLYHGQLANLLPFTLPTIIRILAVMVIFGMFFSQKQNWRKLGQDKWLIAYLILLVIYTLLHLWHVKNFTGLSRNSYGYSASGEIFYLVRMFLPLAIIYFTTEVSLSRHDFKLLVEWLSGLFSGTIVISNLFIISLRSYETGFISANIFEWFVNPNIGYSHMASKGFFNFTNTVGAILFLLLPIILYFLFSSFDWQIATLTALHALAMIELGTKVAAIGLLMGLPLALIVYLIHAYLFKNTQKSGKAVLTAVIIEIAAIAIMPFGPVIQRYNYEIKLARQSDQHLTEAKRALNEGLLKYPSGKQREDFLKDYIEENYQAYALNKRFVFKSYPYQQDPDFWLRIMQEPGQKRMENRHLETQMLNQVLATNHNQLDKVFGISYIRQNNIFNLERDFISQVYSLGWCGMLLFIGPYLLILLYALFKWLTDRRIRSYLISSLIMASAFMLASAYLSGNVMDFLTASLILGFIEGSLLLEIKRRSVK